jgi:hypothetical protein
MNQSPNLPSQKMFLEMSAAAAAAGFSLRHFRRILQHTGIRRIKIGRRFFVIVEDLQRWKDAQRSSRIGQE